MRRGENSKNKWKILLQRRRRLWETRIVDALVTLSVDSILKCEQKTCIVMFLLAFRNTWKRIWCVCVCVIVSVLIVFAKVKKRPIMNVVNESNHISHCLRFNFIVFRFLSFSFHDAFVRVCLCCCDLMTTHLRGSLWHKRDSLNCQTDCWMTSAGDTFVLIFLFCHFFFLSLYRKQKIYCCDNDNCSLCVINSIYFFRFLPSKT